MLDRFFIVVCILSLSLSRSFVIEYTLEKTTRGNQKGTIQRNWQLVHKKKKKEKNSTLIVGHHYMPASTNNVINT
jgi:hypothetical protein